MKTALVQIVCWLSFVFFLYVGLYGAVKMGEWGIGAAAVGIALVFAFAAPSGTSDSTKSKGGKKKQPDHAYMPW